jgi:regulator of nonsense transcripts 2
MVGPAAEPAEVDEDFEREFSQLMMDHQGARPAGASMGGAGGGAPGMAAPAAAAAAAGGHYAQQQQQQGGGSGVAAVAAGEAVCFKVVMRRGGREDRSRELHIPLTAGMAAHLRQKEAAEAVEKAELKRLVLAANSRDQQVGEPRGRRVCLLCGRCRGLVLGWFNSAARWAAKRGARLLIHCMCGCTVAGAARGVASDAPAAPWRPWRRPRLLRPRW